MALKSGDRVGQYEITALIGAGGMGEVYRARDTRLRRDVAIKTLPDSLAGDPSRLARLEREARSLAALNHPNIAILHGVEDHSKVRALVMELVEGRTLAEMIQAAHPGGLPLDESLAIARQIVEGLDAAHERGIVHRDLKPANIKITPDHVVKVLDFGLAKAAAGGEELGQDSTVTSGGTREGTVLGTFAYMSPEQARGQAVDKRTDVWAFGCVLFEMLAGRPAFARATGPDTLTAVLASEPDWSALPGELPAGVRRLLERCLDKNLKRRLRDIGDVRHAIEWTEQEPTPAAPGVSRRTLLTTGTAALGLFGVGFAGGVVAATADQRGGPVTYRRLTFRRGLIRTARFAPDFRTVLYGALWDDDVCRTYSVRPESPESAPLSLPASTPLAISPAGELALALGTHRRGVMTYGTLAHVPQAGGAPRELLEEVKYADWSPDGTELAVVRLVDGRERLEFPVGTIVAEPATSEGGFSFPRVSPRGDAVAFFELTTAGFLEGRVVVASRSGVRTAVSPTYFNVFGLAWHGDEVWFTAADELPLFRNTVHAMTRAVEVRVVARVPGNVSIHDIAPDGRVLIARTDDRSGISVLAPGESLERDLSWLDAPSLADISVDGRQILFSESGVGGGPRLSAYLRGTAGSAAVRLGDGAALALSPDATRAVVRHQAGTPAQVVPTGAGQSRGLHHPGLDLLSARWLRDGRHLVARAEDAGRVARLYLLDADGDSVQPVTPDGLVVGSGWAGSTDGSMVALGTNRGIELHSTSGGRPPRSVPGTSRDDRVVGWIESGLLVSTDPAESDTVLLLDPATGRRAGWREIGVRDAAGMMHRDLGSLVVTPRGDGYGYGWHRAISDLYLVEGWV